MAENDPDAGMTGRLLKTIRQPGETLGEVMAQWKGLSDADKAWYRDAARAQGI
jgi:hypothetical protein